MMGTPGGDGLVGTRLNFNFIAFMIFNDRRSNVYRYGASVIDENGGQLA